MNIHDILAHKIEQEVLSKFPEISIEKRHTLGGEPRDIVFYWNNQVEITKFFLERIPERRITKEKSHYTAGVWTDEWKFIK